MKKNITAILLLLSLFSAKAQKAQYRVLEVSKDVTMQPSDLSGEIAVTDKMLLGIKDMVHFKSGQYIIIESVSNGQWIPYTAKEEELVKVSKIVKKGDSPLISSIRSLFNPGGSNGSGSRGGVVRGDDEYFSLAGKFQTDITSEQAVRNLKRSNQLSLIKHTCGSDLFYPEFRNDTQDSLYVNLICYNIYENQIDVVISLQDGQKELLIRLAPNTSIVLSNLILRENKDRRFIAFGCKKEFSNTQLKRELLLGVSSSPNKQVHVIYGRDYRVKER